MKPYINFNNEKRTQCSKTKDKFGVDQCKLSNNSLFGKQIEDNENYKDTWITDNEEKAKNFAPKITLKNWHILSEYVFKKNGLENLIDTSNFSNDAIFPLEPGKNEKCLGYLKFENKKVTVFNLILKLLKHMKKKE